MKDYRSYEQLIKVSNNDLLDEWDRNMDIYMSEPVRKKAKKKAKKEQKEEC